MQREEVGLLAACYLMQKLSESASTGAKFTRIWSKVGKAAEFCNFPETAARSYFKKWQRLGWLDESYSNLNHCALTSAGHMVAQSVLFFRR